jgi:hypothetical protein
MPFSSDPRNARPIMLGPAAAQFLRAVLGVGARSLADVDIA